MKNILCGLSFLFLLYACKKKENPVITQPPAQVSCNPNSDFTTILGTDPSCNYLFGDTMDWKYDTSWCLEIKNLFNLSTLSLDSTETSSVRFGPSACPNPADTSQNLLFYINAGKPCFTQFVLVDSALNKKFSLNYKAHAGFNLSQIQISSIPLEHGKYYRIYYASHSFNSLFFYKGHGDILIL